jgi:hypothetical protein
LRRNYEEEKEKRGIEKETKNKPKERTEAGVRRKRE